jgi:hypothetical protein
VLNPGSHVPVQLSTLFIVVPDQLINVLVGDVLSALAGCPASDLLGAVIRFKLLPNARLNIGRKSPSFGLTLVADVSLSLR